MIYDGSQKAGNVAQEVLASLHIQLSIGWCWLDTIHARRPRTHHESLSSCWFTGKLFLRTLSASTILLICRFLRQSISHFQFRHEKKDRLGVALKKVLDFNANAIDTNTRSSCLLLPRINGQHSCLLQWQSVSIMNQHLTFTEAKTARNRSAESYRVAPRETTSRLTLLLLMARTGLLISGLSEVTGGQFALTTKVRL